ncbi:MAG: polysaccharide deacetylase family protein [Chloroflexota bacterium]|nr:polysaccharide deacetylase family protein [Chloroflexota bacterium]
MRKALSVAWAAVLLVSLFPLSAAQAAVPAPAAVTRAVTCTDSVGASIAPPPASALVTGLPGYRAQFYGQSGYPTICPGSVSTATIAFHNSGSLGWYLGSAPAYLGTWGPEPGQDRPSILGGDGTLGSPATGWPSANRLALQPDGYVGPGQVAWFRFTVKAPMTPGIYRLGIRPLVEGKQWLDDYGVFWYVTVKQDDETVPQLSAGPRTYYPTLVNGIRQIRVPSLMYHYTDWLPANADRFRVDLTVSPTDFEEHVKYLKANGYTPVTTSEIWWTLDQGGPLPQRPVHLTFDDGTVGNYHYAYKILKKYGLSGTFYISLNLVGREGYITRAMLKEMVDGGMDIQSHGVDHASMLTADQTYQMCTSRRILSEWTGKDVRHFAYPAGEYNTAAFATLARCGYLSAYWKAGGSLQSSDRMYLLYRERVRGGQGLAALLSALGR